MRFSDGTFVNLDKVYAVWPSIDREETMTYLSFDGKGFDGFDIEEWEAIFDSDTKRRYNKEDYNGPDYWASNYFKGTNIEIPYEKVIEEIVAHQMAWRKSS